MESLVSLLPIGLILLVCGGMHLLMMRGMHSGHGAGHENHHGNPTASADDRVASLESEVSRLEEELAASQPAGLRAVNHGRRDPVASSARNNTPDGGGGRCH